MRKRHWVGVVAACFWGFACGGGGGGKDAGTGKDAGPDAADVLPADVPVEVDEVLADPGAGDGEVAVDSGGEVLDAQETGPDVADVSPCGEECSVTNEHGTCKGWRPCVDGGLGECGAPTPAPEVCDGVDNDCDGETDENPAVLCGDGVACTEDRCDGEAGCAHPVAAGACLIGGECYKVGDISLQNECLFCLPQADPLGWSPRPGGCDDGNVCTKRDTCEEGTCVGKENVCQCEANEDCGPYEDGNPCNGTLFCNHAKYPAVCEVDPATVVTCDPSQDTKCLANLCDPATGQCAMAPVFEGEACDDGNACSKDDRCAQGTCAGTPYSCDDQLPCTQDSCDGTGGCNYVLAPYYCVIGEPGAGAACVPHGEHHPDNPCLWCDAQVQASGWSPWSGPCDDGQACTAGDACVGGQCAGEPYACDDGLECTIEACDGAGGCKVVGLVEGFCLIDGACVADQERSEDNECLWCDVLSDDHGWSQNTLPCDDGNACTADDLCAEGLCAGTPAVTCDDDNPCTDDSCDPETGECVFEPNTESCDDGDPCTVRDVCGDGECAGEPYACDDGLDCTIEACDGEGGCEVVALVDSFCLIDGACVAAQTRNPDNECQWCDPQTDPSGWSFHGLGCEDGNPCTTSDTCVRGVCVGGPPLNCNDDNLCTNDSCDPSVAEGCVHENNTAPCDDGNSCTVGDVCSGGQCQAGPVNACECEDDSGCPDDGNACNGRLVCDTGVYPHRCVVDPATVVTCDASGDTTCLKNQCSPSTGQCAMTPVNEGGACEDGNPCSYGDKCQTGSCLGIPYDCDDGLVCTNDVCRGDGTCEHLLAAGSCLIGGACVEEGSGPGDNECLVCDPGVQKYTWTPKQNGIPCDDGEACTHSDACKSGQCRGVGYGCDDRLACTDDACRGDGTCDHVTRPGYCLIDGVCREDGAENGPCLSCDSTQNQSGWTARADGTPCDDEEACTAGDQCIGGECSGTSYDCDDGLWCTRDACLGDGTCDHATVEAEACLIGGACHRRGDEDPQNPCRRCVPEQSQTQWTPKADGTVCSDHDECTVNDRCEEGECVSGPARNCDDQNPCTTDRCEPEVGCVNQANDFYRVDFEDAGNFTFENSDPVVGWQVVTTIPGYASAALYYGNPETWSYDTGAVPNEGTAYSEVLQLTEGQPAFLSFDMFLDNEWSNRLATGGQGRQWNDVVEVVLSMEGIGEITVWSSTWGSPQWWVQTPSGVPLRPKPVRVSGVDLASQLQWYGYPPFRLGFRFRTGDERMNDFGGVVVDNIVIGRTCGDGNACTGGDSCQDGQCVGMLDACDDANDCTGDSCDPAFGCRHNPANDEASCDDYDECTEGTTCTMGWCSGGNPVVCEDDGNDCTGDACDSLAGCSHQPLPDFTECSQADPYGTCLGGVCVPWQWELYLAGDYSTGFNAAERVEGGPLSVAGFTDVPNGILDEAESPAMFDLDLLIAMGSPDESEGELLDLSGGLAVGYEFDEAVGQDVPRSAAWDAGSGQWTFDAAMNPVHVPADGDAGLFGVFRPSGWFEWFAGGLGQVGDLTSYLERCRLDPGSGLWSPCEPMAAFRDRASCQQFDFLQILGIWAANAWNVFAVGTSYDFLSGQSLYTILYHDGNMMTDCTGPGGTVSGFQGAFAYDPTWGWLQPASGGSGEGKLMAIHGRDGSNIWAVGTGGMIVARSPWGWGWTVMNPANDGMDWDDSHTGFGVFVEDKDVHIVGSRWDMVPFYLHAGRTDDWMNPWVFDRKVEFWELQSDHSVLRDVTRDPVTGALEAVGSMYVPDTDENVGIRIRLAPAD